MFAIGAIPPGAVFIIVNQDNVDGLVIGLPARRTVGCCVALKPDKGFFEHKLLLKGQSILQVLNSCLQSAFVAN